MTDIEVERSGDAIATIRLNRPEKKNALSIAVRDEVTATLAELAGDQSVKVVMLTGAGSAFCAGFDLAEFQRLDDPDHAARLWESSDRFHHACLTFPLPLLAVVNGPALAGGFDLAVMCDVRIAGASACFSHPEHTFGDVVYSPLHDIVGGGVARDLVLSGRRVEADEAVRLGLVNMVVPDDQLSDAARTYAATVAAAPRDLLVRTKAKIIARAGVQLGATLDL